MTIKGKLVLRIGSKKFSGSSMLLSTAVFLLAAVIAAVLFKHRTLTLFHSIPYPDHDYEGTLWNVWFQAFADQKGFSYLWNNYFSFPYYSDLTYLPMDNLFFDLFSFYLRLTGRNLANLVFITNSFSLLTFPLCTLAAYHLSRRINLSFSASLIAGITYAFSYDHVMSLRGITIFGSYFLIPWSLSSLIGLIKNKRFYDCCLFSLVYGCLLATDAYYGFYTAFAGLILAVAVFASEPWSWKESVRTMVWSVLAIALVVILNLKYLVPYAHFFFASSSREAIGRVTDFSVIPMQAFFLPSQTSFLWTRLLDQDPRILERMGGGSLLAYGSIFLAFLGVFQFRRMTNQQKAIALGVLFFGAVSLAIASDIPAGEPLRKFYIENFPLFRSVGRLNRIISLSVALLSGFGFEWIRLSVGGGAGKRLAVLTAIFCGLILGEGLTVNSTWFKTVDTRNFDSIYKSLRDDKSIQSIMSFPRDVPYARMLNYIQMSQIAHEKKVNGALDPQSRYQPYFLHTLEITPSIINNAINQGYDAILIFEQIYGTNTRKLVPGFLFEDERLELFDHRHGPHPRTGIPAVMDASFSVIIFKIKEPFRVKLGNGDPSYSGFFRGTIEQLPYPLLEKYRIATVDQGSNWPRFETFDSTPSATNLHHGSQDGNRAYHYFFLPPELISMLLGVFSFVMSCSLVIFLASVYFSRLRKKIQNAVD